jgi:hypothetical protein
MPPYSLLRVVRTLATAVRSMRKHCDKVCMRHHLQHTKVNRIMFQVLRRMQTELCTAADTAGRPYTGVTDMRPAATFVSCV